jgi:hypothetical protein
MTARDLKTFKLKARGDAGAGKTELLAAFAALLRRFGMTAELREADHHLIVTATKAQRNALYRFNRCGVLHHGEPHTTGTEGDD